jgi:hypothetical protein
MPESPESGAASARSALRPTAGCAWMRFCRGINDATSRALLVMAHGWPDGARRTLRGFSLLNI